MRREVPEDPSRHCAAVPSSVEGQVLPGVGVPVLGKGLKIRGIREDPVEPPNAAGQVRPDDLDGKAFRSGPASERGESRWVEVRRDDPEGVGSGSLQGGESPSAADLEHPQSTAALGEAGQQPAVLPDGIHRYLPLRARMRHDSRSGDRRVPKSS